LRPKAEGPVLPQMLSLKKKKSPLDRKEAFTGFLFVAPLLLGICVLTLIPVIATFALSFTEWNFIAGIEQLQWVGLENFQQLAQDTVFLKSLANNAIFMLTTPICMIISLLLAIIINKYVYMKDYFKVVYFCPMSQVSWLLPLCGRSYFTHLLVRLTSS